MSSQYKSVNPGMTHCSSRFPDGKTASGAGKRIYLRTLTWPASSRGRIGCPSVPRCPAQPPAVPSDCVWECPFLTCGETGDASRLRGPGCLAQLVVRLRGPDPLLPLLTPGGCQGGGDERAPRAPGKWMNSTHLIWFLMGSSIMI